jgi:hypothetical protein
MILRLGMAHSGVDLQARDGDRSIHLPCRRSTSLNTPNRASVLSMFLPLSVNMGFFPLSTSLTL